MEEAAHTLPLTDLDTYIQEKRQVYTVVCHIPEALATDRVEQSSYYRFTLVGEKWGVCMVSRLAAAAPSLGYMRWTGVSFSDSRVPWPVPLRRFQRVTEPTLDTQAFLCIRFEHIFLRRMPQG